MFKVLLAGLFGIAVAVALAIFGYQAGYFDSFRKGGGPAPQVAGTAPQQGTKSAKAPAAGKAPVTGKDGGADVAAKASAPQAGSSATGAADAQAEATQAIAPTFDVVRVEPSGDAVLAGLAEADATVALVANGKVIAKTKSNSAGEWAIVLDDPLKPGDYDIAIHSEKDGEAPAESTQRVTVSIPKDRDAGDVLVVMNAEGEPSTILQRPGERQPSVVASSEQPAGNATPGATEPGAADQEAEALARETAEAVSAPQEPAATSAAEAEMKVAAAQSEAAGADETRETAGQGEVVAKADDESANGTPPEPEPAGEEASPREPAPAQDLAAADSAKTDEEKAVSASAEATVASAAGGAAGQAPEASGAPETPRYSVTVDAVESEKGKIFVAGTSNPGATLRIYLGEDYLGETTARANGRWLLETEHEMQAGKHDVRADLVKGAEGTVLARAEVTFERAPDAVILAQVAAEGSAGEGTGASASATARVPNVIIRKGDNLWTISRRLYGKGIRYTTIYEANQGQIRNPDLIYPGQVFLTPVGDDAWKGDTEDPSATN
ncbi:LysM peptidoglycan-binding domain-containing protein [Breoghania sp. JC706]|uniref:LysM peptidoglycan-binding domain-containing protein n=1 Tax=Breoghania sp. JC706 TaxID=3117732 RepID=UPI003009FE07